MSPEPPFSYAVLTFGCRVNQADSLRLEAALVAAGAAVAPPDRADVVVVNTCSVTATADQGARQTIRRLQRDRPSVQIVATGCYASRCADDVGALPGVVRVVPNADKDDLARHALDVAGMSTAARYGDGDGPCGALLAPGLGGRTAWTVRVQTGCAESCAFCIIPTTRGRPRSRSVPDILSEIARVVDAGYKEVVLAGVHLGAWGHDQQPAASLHALLVAIAGREFPARFRVSSLEPVACTPDVIEVIASSGAFAPHLHLPLQHASDRMLRAMRRPYTAAEYARVVDEVRSLMPDASIGTDVIVGYPGESDADAATLVEYLEDSPLTHVHVFPYSDRPGTLASTLPEKVHGTRTRMRGDAVRAAGRGLHERFKAAHVGRVRPALTLEDGTLAVTDNYLKVRIPPGHPRNEWVRVRILAAGETMRGEVER